MTPAELQKNLQAGADGQAPATAQPETSLFPTLSENAAGAKQAPIDPSKLNQGLFAGALV